MSVGKCHPCDISVSWESYRRAHCRAGLWHSEGCEAANAQRAGCILNKQHGGETLACGAHRLQTCIQHALNASRPLQNFLTRCRQLVGHFNRSALQMERLAAAQPKKPPLKVLQDCATRWNSSFYMCERLLRLKYLSLLSLKTTLQR